MDKLYFKACCFTGHRPQKLSFGLDEEDPACRRLKEELQNEILEKINQGCITFLTGMAMGADIWCAEIVLAFKKKYADMPVMLTAVIPFRSQPNSFPAGYMKRYAEILNKADNIVTIAEKYAPGCMHRRNKYMVDHADCLIAVSSGVAGGTQETLTMAKKKGRDIVLFHPDSLYRVHIPSQIRFE